MKILKEIFGRIWALWGLITFVVTIIIAYLFYWPCHFLKEPQKAIWHRKVSRVWMFVYLHLIFSPLTVKGAEYFKGIKNCVVVCNHNSFVDILITTPFMPHANKTIAKSSFAIIPIFGWIYGFGSVLVNRNDNNSRRKSFEDMKRVLSYGLDMVIYPEGTRNRTNKPLKEFYDGAFKLAKDCNKPVIPTLVFYTTKVLPVKKTFFMWPHHLEMHFLPPVESTNISAKELKEKVFTTMWNYFEAHNKS